MQILCICMLDSSKDSDVQGFLKFPFFLNKNISISLIFQLVDTEMCAGRGLDVRGKSE